MDTQSYLMSLGWAGPGHPLHPSAYKQKGHRGLAYNPNEIRAASTGNGLIKPLLVSRKENNLGLGRRAHVPQQGNEWWLKGFEKALGDIGKSESERSSGVSTPVRGQEGNYAGLYSFFVKGQQMQGTIEEDGKVTRRKWKSDAISSDDSESSEDKAAANEFEAVATFMAVRDHDKKSNHRRAKSTPHEEFKQAGQFFQVRDAKPKKKRKSETREALQQVENGEVKLSPEVKPRKRRKSDVLDEMDGASEARGERRERRRKRKGEKETKIVDASALMTGGHGADKTAAKAARKEERRRQKAKKAVTE